MSLHHGNAYRLEDVQIGTPIPEEILASTMAEEMREEVVAALNWAMESEQVYYFSVFHQGTLVGQIYLHDIGCEPETALIGYHLFQPSHRGKGIGTKALSLLKQFANREKGLKCLIIITGTENKASRSIAEKNGFQWIGGAREDPENSVVYQWNIRV